MCTVHTFCKGWHASGENHNKVPALNCPTNSDWFEFMAQLSCKDSSLQIVLGPSCVLFVRLVLTLVTYYVYMCARTKKSTNQKPNQDCPHDVPFVYTL